MASLKASLRPARQLDSLRGRTDYILPLIMKFIREQHALVEPLYRMERDGQLSGEGKKGREGLPFMNGQIVKGSLFLADLWYSAYRNAPEDRYLLGVLAKRKLSAGGKSNP